jgi:hypothetical protein
MDFPTLWLRRNPAGRGSTIVEFTNIPENMRIGYQSTPVLQVQLRGTAWLLESVNLSRVVAYFDLNDSVEGKRIFPVSRAALNLPPGVEVDRISPESVSIDLLRELGPPAEPIDSSMNS